MPEYFVLRYYSPSNLINKKIEKLLNNPFIIQKDINGTVTKIEILTYRTVYNVITRTFVLSANLKEKVIYK